MTNSLIEKQIVIKLQQLDARQQQQVLNFTKGLINQDNNDYLTPKVTVVNSTKSCDYGLVIENIEDLSEQIIRS